VTGFDLYPAIDVRGGRCVRLLRGDYERETVYGDDPVAQARRFEAAGARWIHVVDLDAARTGEPVNRPVVEAICAAVGCRVQASGGVRTVADADALIAAGVERVVVGTAAVEDPALVEEMAAAHPRRIAVGLDARGRDVAVRGWTESTGRDLVDVARAIEDRGAAALVVTEIGRDGTLEGPALDQLAAVLEAVGVPVVASGGVGSLDDLRALAALDVGGRRLAGAIAGRAIYEGRFEVEEGLAACSRPG
jgi:phosphoribosylformimino-5-aminoimidazole carboxamide ribotide isomerase